MQDFHLLPKLRDSLSYLYIEHAVIEREEGALLVLQETGATRVPIADLCVLMLGPGVSITHAAIRLLSEHGCSVLWTGEDMNLFYAQGLGETRKSYHLIRQAELVSVPEKRMRVVLRMYQKRFQIELSPDMSLEQIRGMEGARVKNAYANASRKYGVPWHGRNYDLSNWTHGDPINRAISAANAVLNGVCHAAIVSGGYSPALGFVHTGRQLSFVYDAADLYKVELTIPIAFQTVAEGPENVDRRARQACREYFREVKLLEKILPDIDELLEIGPEPVEVGGSPVAPVPWWVPDDVIMTGDTQP